MGLGLKSDLNMHRAHSGSLRVRIEARHEWVERSGKLIFERQRIRWQRNTGTGKTGYGTAACTSLARQNSLRQQGI
jgi:hypothetical protein